MKTSLGEKSRVYEVLKDVHVEFCLLEYREVKHLRICSSPSVSADPHVSVSLGRLSTKAGFTGHATY